MITVGVVGFKEFRKAMSNVDSQFYSLAKHSLTKATEEIHGKATDKAPFAFGKLKGSIRQGVRGLKAEVVAGSKYASFVEYGTRPHFPPVAALEPWAALKLGSAGLAYAVARKIAIRGTKAQPFMRPAVDESLSKIRSIFKDLLNDMIKIMKR
jgi:HK97 gp10 family phage protein